MKEEAKTCLRCRPGDLAKIVYSRTPSLKGKRVVVRDWSQRYGRWEVQLLDGPHLGLSIKDGRPMLSSRCYFQDSSLEPIYPRRIDVGEEMTSVSLR
ncbi:hypothetical protein A8E25_10085 [Burkholderia cenocepacia]|jgi:hypothetical protein|uniref:Hypothetical phage protein n=1 Tax=Burkholderia cenocepacia (strain ATCC BAA-245 / DSM 16553 / LMG 16656 / NCTC 13227 / J2315 / CF5610) TaxID=216591 RepID=B4EFQ9_BURCJ|nr:hypothetical protein NP88_2262 [Burkholderia cepacia]KKI81607.1 hypothetical protein WQ49_16240 [Burkholderia cenocepacia]CAR54908.1 hypothetical phage protein [Burkholderia cenocepacia J2315]ONR50481.1 hypothetical protein A8E17_33370 [Burkholderia cenocepacia]ONR65088.1 hypothetical protein A8E18_27390 [Burkholderia cenocepacia]